MAELFIGNTQISGSSGGSADLSNYYNKSEIDSSFGETYLVKITNSAGYYCYVPRTMSDADRQYILSTLNKSGGVVKIAYPSNITAQIGTDSNSAGYYTRATGSYSHAEGSYTNASGPSSHAQGNETTASGNYSHAEGNNTNASGSSSHAEGYFTNAKADYQHVEGKFNSDAANSILIVGNGTNYDKKHNALEVHLSGDVKIPDTHATGEVYEKPMFVLQDKLYQIDSSIIALEANSGSGSADMSNYYTKSHIDTSISALDASCRTYAPVEYTTLDDYNELVDEQTVDANKLYIITDLADADDLADYISTTDIETELNTRADSIISTADSSMVFWKNTRVSEADTAITSAKNTAVSAVQSARSSAVSAVESAQSSAVSAVNTAAASIPSFVVMTESAYSQLTPDSNTIYFLTE